MADSSLYKVLNAFKNNFGEFKHTDLDVSKNNGDEFWVFMRNHQFLVTILLSIPVIYGCVKVFFTTPFMTGHFDTSVALLLLFVLIWGAAFLLFVFIGLMLLEAIFSLFKQVDPTMEGFYRGFMSNMILNRRKEAFMRELGVDTKNMGSYLGKSGDLSFLSLVKDFEVSVSGGYEGRYEKKIANDLLSYYESALVSNKKGLAKAYLSDGAWYLIDKMRRHFRILESERSGQMYSWGKLKTEQIEIEILY